VNRRLTPVALGVLSFAAIFAGWELAVRAGWLNPFFTSQPTAIAAALVRSARSGELWQTVRVTLAEFAAGFGAAIAVGLLVGVAAGRWRPIEYAVDPFIWFAYSAPLIAFYPLFVLWLGLGTRTVVAISFLLSVTPIAVNTTSGIRQVNVSLILAARSFGASERDLLWKVVLPASVPMIVAGLRLGVGRALTGVVVAELFVPSGGIGSSIAYNAGLLRTTNMLAALMAIVVLGVICTQGLSAIEARFDAWRTGPGL
jgi:NitT/TauT family transport system permease protein